MAEPNTTVPGSGCGRILLRTASTHIFEACTFSRYHPNLINKKSL